MGTSKEDIRTWLEEGLDKGATHVIVACDTFSYEDYPIFVMPGDDAKKIHDKHNGPNMQKVMEVYNLSLDIDEQLNEWRSFNF